MSLRDRLATFWNRINGASDPAFALRSLPVYDAGSYITPESALTVSAVWACIDTITRSLAPAPWRVFQVEGVERNLRPDDQFTWLLNTRPNPHTTAIAFRESLLWSCMAGGGNGYAEIQRDLAGRPVALWPIEPDRVTPMRSESGDLYYQVAQFNDGTVDVDPSRVFHLRGPSIYGLVGDNILYRASQSIAIAKSAQTFAAGYYANGTVASGVLKHPKRLDQKAIERLRAEWAERHSGTRNSYKPIILEEGMEWQGLSEDPEKSQLQEVRSFAVEEVARYFGVPLILLGDRKAPNSRNITELYLSFIRACLNPWCRRLEQEADYKLFPQRAPWRESRIDLSELTRPSLAEELGAYVQAHEGGILTLNQILRRLGENTIGEDGDEYLAKTSLTTRELILQPPEPPAPVAAPPAAEPDQADAEDPAEQDDTEDAPASGDMMNAATLDAVSLVLAPALDRYQRVLKNRRADYEKQAPAEAGAKIAAAKTQLLAQLADECAPGISLLRRVTGYVEPAPLAKFAEAVEQGEPPRLAADRLVALLAHKTPSVGAA